MIHDIIIIGAGPAGATCALALRDRGLKVAIVDKHVFPRDKTCGDAIPALCGRVLERIDPVHKAKLVAFREKVDTKSCLVVSPSGHRFSYTFQTSGWSSTRLVFDQFLLDLAMEGGKVDAILGNAVKKIAREGDVWGLQVGDEQIQSKYIVGADGANGITARSLTDQQLDPKHHCAAVRQYFLGIKDIHENQMEIHLVRDFLPGYFWIFPLGNGLANVGFGMMREDISKRKISLRDAMPSLISTTAGLSGRFSDAVPQGNIQGFGLPMGSRKVNMSGDGFLLCGDAAALVEPATGEGIGNAMYSGLSAAETILASIQAGDPSATFLSLHDKKVYGKLWKGMRYKHLTQKWVGGNAFMLDQLIRLAGNRGPLNWLVKRIF